MKRNKILSGFLAFSFPCLLNATVVLPLKKDKDSQPLKMHSNEKSGSKQLIYSLEVDSLNKIKHNKNLN